MDGTFSFCTKYFYQFFTIHTIKNGVYIPLLFCLLKDKHASTYQFLFESLKQLCLENLILLNPEEIVIDFEPGLHKAAKDTWPNIKIVGCRFHLSQSWYRKIQHLGIV